MKLWISLVGASKQFSLRSEPKERTTIVPLPDSLAVTSGQPWSNVRCLARQGNLTGKTRRQRGDTGSENSDNDRAGKTGSQRGACEEAKIRIDEILAERQLNAPCLDFLSGWGGSSLRPLQHSPTRQFQ
jgi:hypothetical protein